MNTYTFRMLCFLAIITLSTSSCAVFDALQDNDSDEKSLPDTDAGDALDAETLDAEILDGETPDPDGSDASSIMEEIDPVFSSSSAADILWVIDNSDSMCRKQQVIQQSFEQFIHETAQNGLDFQIGVTTTDMSQSSRDPVARPGYLQATPQPIPSPWGACTDRDNPKNTDDDSFNGYPLIRSHIRQAINCTKNPARWAYLEDVRDKEIACAYGWGDPNACSGMPQAPYELFPFTSAGDAVSHETTPEESPYRALRGGGKILRSADYRIDTTGKLDFKQLSKDFACMSLVGTRGSNFEKGLAASVRAISPAMTGGTAEAPLGRGANAPNHGFLRKDANFALIFVTKANDCSDYALFAGENALKDAIPFTNAHDDSIKRGVNERTACGDLVCAAYNTPGFDNSPLIQTDKLAERLLKNLSDSKQETLNEDDVVIASIHGEPRRYGETDAYPSQADLNAAIAREPHDNEQEIRNNINAFLADPNSCPFVNGLVAPYTPLAEKPTCIDETMERAYSGDRYARFLRNFNPDRTIPSPSPDANVTMPGLVCGTEQIGTALGQMGKLIARTSEQCMPTLPPECSASEDCPAFRFGSQTPTCGPPEGSNRKFCDSSLELRLFPGENTGRTLEDIRNHAYCIQASVDSAVAPGGCVISPDKYRVLPCGLAADAIKLSWTEPGHFNELSGYEVRAFYRSTEL